jgi:hypothetical protein
MAQYPRQFKREYLPITIRPLWGLKLLLLILIVIVIVIDVFYYLLSCSCNCWRSNFIDVDVMMS